MLRSIHLESDEQAQPNEYIDLKQLVSSVFLQHATVQG